jgi:Toprim domain
MIDLTVIDQLTGGRLGKFDVPCPECSPLRSNPRSRRLPVLRIWHIDENFAGYHCAHCGKKGHARNRNSKPLDPEELARARMEAAERERAHKMERLHKALWLWTSAIPIADTTPGTIAETYLRNRGYCGPVQNTVRFLPARGQYAPAMIAAFGIPTEVETGVIRIAADAIKGVHITRLLSDGSDRERGDKAKIMIGHSIGWPIVLAPPNDLLGLAIAEGIEDALTLHHATGLGAWAAGSATRMPPLADVVPDYIECVTIAADDDDTGRSNAEELARRLGDRGIEARVTPLGAWDH